MRLVSAGAGNCYPPSSDSSNALLNSQTLSVRICDAGADFARFQAYGFLTQAQSPCFVKAAAVLTRPHAVISPVGARSRECRRLSSRQSPRSGEPDSLFSVLAWFLGTLAVPGSRSTRRRRRHRTRETPRTDTPNEHHRSEPERDAHCASHSDWLRITLTDSINHPAFPDENKSPTALERSKERVRCSFSASQLLSLRPVELLGTVGTGIPNTAAKALLAYRPVARVIWRTHHSDNSEHLPRASTLSLAPSC